MNSSVRVLDQASLWTRALTVLQIAAIRSLSLRVLGMTMCLVLPMPFLFAQSTPESPVKVHGGAGTFFTQDRRAWVPLPGQKQTFCSAISAAEINQLHVSGFYNMTSEFTRQGARTGQVVVNPFNWRIEFLGHDPQALREFRVQPQGILLQASRLDCNDKRTGTPSVRISPLAGATFYSTDLLPTQKYPGNKRFRSTQAACTGEATDLCERVAQVKVFPSADSNDTKPATLTLNCPDGACTVYIGKLQFVSLAPTVRTSPAPEGARPTAR